MDENSNLSETTYKVYSSKEKSNGHTGKNILVSFCSSAIATFLVIGICFGNTNIRNKILGDNGQTTYSNNGLTITEGAVSNTVALTDYSNTAIAVANKVLPSIVGITVEYKVNSMFGGSTTTEASGSGIIVSSDGYILTNNHVVNNTTTSYSYYQITEATGVKVKLYNDDTEYEAKVIGSDAQTDLAVIKIDKTDLIAAELGDSDSVQVGEFAMAIGNPLGLQSSITCGIISAIKRDVQDSDTGVIYNLIQTDAAINSGNSGGALVNADGKVIGINTLKLSGSGVEGIGFAIPINSTIDVYNELKTKGKVARPYIGIAGRDVDERTAAYYNLVVGVYVQSVDAYSAAEKAGLKVGDVIIAIDGKEIKTMDELTAIKNEHKIGDEIKLKINRNGNEQEISLILQEQ